MKMDESTLLHLLQTKEDSAASYVHGQLGSEREASLRQYHRLPYGNEEEGWSQIVTSDVQNTVEWILPDLLDIFISTDKAVVFEPTRASEAEGAEQATAAVNYIFHKQNNGFLNLYTAFKDALIVRNGILTWRKEKERKMEKQRFNGWPAEALAMAQADGWEFDEDDIELIGQTPDQFGQVVNLYRGELEKEVESSRIVVSSIEPENLLIERTWTSPLLQDCPYVCVLVNVTLSELHEWGYDDVTAEELSASNGVNSADKSFRLNRVGTADAGFNNVTDIDASAEDESLSTGWLRVEYVRCDYDGDGVAELRCVYRLNDKILKNEETSHVPIATASPVLNTHRWDGMSIADLVADLQLLHTELTRQTLNSLYLANMPRSQVMTDANWSPLANIDDLLDARPGGIIRVRTQDAIQNSAIPFVGQQSLPVLEYVQGMLEQRTGVTRYNQGLDADSLNKTASGIKQIKTAGQQRIKLIARIFAEILVKPCMQGILKLLTCDGDMEKVAFRLRGTFVEYDPNGWRDQYDMSINVGLGSGDREIQLGMLNQILGQQMTMIQGGLGGVLVDERKLHTTLTKMVEVSGYQNTGDFWIDPNQSPKTVDSKKAEASQAAAAQVEMQKQMAAFNAQLALQLEQAKGQISLELERIKSATKLKEQQGQLELQATNDARDAEREMLKAQYEQHIKELELQLEKYRTDQDNATRLVVAQLNKPPQPIEPLMAGAHMAIQQQSTELL